jgi:hypothetical protein
MLPLILAGLAGAAITAIVMVEDEETKKREDEETIAMLDKAKQLLDDSNEAIVQRNAQIEELEQLIAELTAKHGVNHSEVMEPINTY